MYYVAAVELALGKRKAAAMERVATAWDDLLSAWTELDEILGALSAAGTHFSVGRTPVSAIRRLIGALVDRNIAGSV